MPSEPESAALGGALQAAAVHQDMDVADFILAHPPAVDGDAVQPDSANAALYREAHEQHCELGTTLFAASAPTADLKI